MTFLFSLHSDAINFRDLKQLFYNVMETDVKWRELAGKKSVAEAASHSRVYGVYVDNCANRSPNIMLRSIAP